MHFLPSNLFWLEPVIIASLVVFVVDLIGNLISFSSRFTNALITAIIFGLIFGALVKANMGGVRMDLPTKAQIGEKMNEMKTDMKGKVDALKDRVKDINTTPAPAAPTAPAAPK